MKIYGIDKIGLHSGPQSQVWKTPEGLSIHWGSEGASQRSGAQGGVLFGCKSGG